MIWFISDLHMNNTNVINYENRPFADPEEMNEALIANWNDVVAPEDDVFVLGDFIMGQADTIHTLLPRFNGKIHLIIGNHDTPAKQAIYSEYPDKIVEMKEVAYIRYKGLFFVLCHFPLTNEAFLKMVQQDNSEVVVVHGHVHSKAPFFNVEQHTFNVSCEATEYVPVSIQRLFEIVRDDFIQKGVWGTVTSNQMTWQEYGFATQCPYCKTVLEKHYADFPYCPMCGHKLK